MNYASNRYINTSYNNINIIKIKNGVRFVFGFVVLFLFLTEVPIADIIMSRQLAGLIALIYIIANLNRFSKTWHACKLYYLIVPLILLIVPFLLTIINGIGLNKNSSYDYYEPWYFIYLIVYIVLFSVFTVMVFGDLHKFCCAFIVIMVIQSIVVLISALDTSFSILIYNNLYSGDSRFDSTIANGTRVVGIGIGGASGSLLFFLATALLVYISINNDIKNIAFTGLYCLITVATAFVGRTGFYLEIGLLLYYLLLVRGISRKLIFIFLGTAIVLIGMQFVTSNMKGYAVEHFSRWVGEIFVPETRYRTINAIADMKIPKLTLETLCGTNIVRGVSAQGTHISNDSGFIMIYFALGLIGAIHYYLAFIVLYFKGISGARFVERGRKLFIIMLAMLAFIIEVKEPFTMKYVYSYVLFTLIIFERKRYSIENAQGDDYLYEQNHRKYYMQHL